MLGKLLKYELRSNVRTFFPLYGAILLLALILRFCWAAEFANVIIGTGGLIMSALYAAIGVLTLVMIVQRFNKNLLGEEGYLMFTLPVPTETLILSKLISALLWSALSGIVGMLSMLLLAVDREMIQAIGYVFQHLPSAFANFTGEDWGLLITMVLFFLFLYVDFVLAIYASYAVGQVFHKHRSLIAGAAFLVIFIIAANVSWKLAWACGDPNTALMCQLALAVAFAAGLFALTDVLLKKKLNLE